ncbi:NAD(P)H-dependent oxidoreductase [Rhizobiales bacterium]|uniref:NAD(P)H-dependent oxidoreductase n=1 Tax=Hongsoonwoonella zoysiae TaxID=2821844 RepID=UPI001560993A|nr:NAD(P)H-dependent oxidoreductase [Hongsoonwoonella zoysiae]NRG17257.1 NAD(P)H-dependent oxidoreductase [Hongsoonwoonella zoysiae]
MRVLVVYAHPVGTSYCAALKDATLAALGKNGHEIDLLDLYAEDFEPRLSQEERIAYHDIDANRAPVEDYVRRLLKAEGLVLVYPVWNFGFPAILKGYFDRVFLPGVSFELVDGTVVPALRNIRKLAAVTTYGATPLRAFLAGNPPKRLVKRVLRAVIRPGAPVTYLAHYDMNNSTPETRKRFLGRVHERMQRY